MVSRAYWPDDVVDVDGFAASVRPETDVRLLGLQQLIDDDRAASKRRA
jgi:hypothetical protein